MSGLLRRLRDNLCRYMACPAILLFGVFFILPFLQGIGISLTNWNGFSTPEFVGLQNFIDFFSDKRAMRDLQTTLWFGLLVPLCMNALGLFLALFLDQKLLGRNALRAVIYTPCVISSLVMGYIWVLILRRDGGALHDLMKLFGMGASFKIWLANPVQARYVILIVNVWQHVGTVMIIYLAGLQSIPQELYEVSCIEGAGYLQNLRSVTLPLLLPSIKINVIMNVIGSLAMFESIVALTDGGPGYFTETMSLFIYRMSFGANTGFATATAMILFTITAVPTLLLFWALSKRNVEM